MLFLQCLKHLFSKAFPLIYSPCSLMPTIIKANNSVGVVNGLAAMVAPMEISLLLFHGIFYANGLSLLHGRDRKIIKFRR